MAPAEPQQGDETLDYAVQMLQFDDELQADRLLARNQLTIGEMSAFGARLAAQHAQLPELAGPYDPGEAMLDNFITLRGLRCAAPLSDQLDVLESQAASQLAVHGGYLQERRGLHFVRECHGDLHLSNLARLDGGITAFDCLEFDEALRHIDVWCDAGFLFMDCCVRDRADLAYAFVDGYTSANGDYAGVGLLPMFAAYRSVVRAKIAALRFEQAGEEKSWAKLERHLQWPLAQQAREPGRLLVTYGLSGSGKSFWSEQLVARAGCIRLRSDVLRKTRQGYAPLADSGSEVGGGLYTPLASTQVYASLAEFAEPLLAQGEHVLVDAACLQRSQRECLYAAAAAAGARVDVLHFFAPPSVLRARIRSRAASGDNPSEADEQVLDWQLEGFEAHGDDEPVTELDTQLLTLDELVARLELG